MSRRVVEKLCTKKVCVDFLAPGLKAGNGKRCIRICLRVNCLSVPPEWQPYCHTIAASLSLLKHDQIGRDNRLLGQSEWQNESSPNFSRMFVPNLAPNFPRIFRGVFVLSFPGNGDQKHFHQKSLPFFNTKFPGNYATNDSQCFRREGKVTFASTVSALAIGATSCCHPGRHAHVVTLCLLTPCLNLSHSGPSLFRRPLKTTFVRSGKTDPVQFNRAFQIGPFWLVKWAFCKQFSPLRYRIFRSLEKGKFVFQTSLSETPFKPDRVSFCTPNFDMTTLIFSTGGCPSYPFYSSKRGPWYPVFRENPSREVATEDHSSSNPPKGNPPDLKTKVDVSKVDVKGFPNFVNSNKISEKSSCP